MAAFLFLPAMGLSGSTNVGKIMNISPIRTDQDHDLALARIGELFDAEMGTPEGDELDILATLVEAYEEHHYPIEPPTPVEDSSAQELTRHRR